MTVFLLPESVCRLCAGLVRRRFISRKMFLSALFGLIYVCFLTQAQEEVYVGWNSRTHAYSIHLEKIPNAVSWAVFDQSINETG